MPGGLNPAVTWYSSTFGKGIYVAVGNNLGVSGSSASAWSLDGINWIPGGLPDGAWLSVAFGNGIFVASQGTRGPFGNGPGTAYSTDGKTWRTDNTTIPISTGSLGYNTICFAPNDNGGTFCTLGYGVNHSYTSTDGYTWTAQTFANPTAFNYSQITSGSDRYVVVGTTGTSGYSSMYLMFGASTWNVGTSDLPVGFGLIWFKSVIFDGSQFYTAGAGLNNSGIIYSSFTGFNWTLILTTSPPISKISFKPGGKWVICGDNFIKNSDYPQGPYVSSTPPEVVGASNWQGLNYIGDKFIAIGPQGVQGNGYSFDGIIWNIAASTGSLFFDPVGTTTATANWQTSSSTPITLQIVGFATYTGQTSPNGTHAITGLAPNTTYTGILSDGVGEITRATFTTLPSTIVSTIEVLEVTSTTALVQWATTSTNGPFRIHLSGGASRNINNLSPNGTYLFTNLAENTDFQVQLFDNSGTALTSLVYFTTPPLPTSTLTFTQITATTARATWATESVDGLTSGIQHDASLFNTPLSSVLATTFFTTLSPVSFGLNWFYSP